MTGHVRGLRRRGLLRGLVEVARHMSGFWRRCFDREAHRSKFLGSAG